MELMFWHVDGLIGCLEVLCVNKIPKDVLNYLTIAVT